MRGDGNVIKNTIHPLEQARQYAHTVLEALQDLPAAKEDKRSNGLNQVLRWSYGVVLTNISRRDVHNIVIDSTRLDSSVKKRCWIELIRERSIGACGICFRILKRECSLRMKLILFDGRCFPKFE